MNGAEAAAGSLSPAAADLSQSTQAAAGAAGSTAETVLLILWLLLLSLWDIRRKELPAWLLAAGGTVGLLLRIIDLASGCSAAALGSAYLPGLAAGALLIAAARISGEAVGYGDGICFCLLAFWLPWEELFTLLLTALLFCALPGLLIGLIRGRRVKALPFLPFVAGAYLALRLAALALPSGEALP